MPSPSPSARAVRAVNRRLAEQLSAREISRSPEVRCDVPDRVAARRPGLFFGKPWNRVLRFRSALTAERLGRERKGLHMAITQMTRFKSDKADEMIKNAKNAKTIFQKHGAEFLRMSRFHTGLWAGEWLVVTRYANWEVYGRAQHALSSDPDYAKLMANTAGIAQMTGRNITVGVDL
jgi:hypothetical protein